MEVCVLLGSKHEKITSVAQFSPCHKFARNIAKFFSSQTITSVYSPFLEQHGKEYILLNAMDVESHSAAVISNSYLGYVKRCMTLLTEQPRYTTNRLFSGNRSIIYSRFQRQDGDVLTNKYLNASIIPEPEVSRLF